MHQKHKVGYQKGILSKGSKINTIIDPRTFPDNSRMPIAQNSPQWELDDADDSGLGVPGRSPGLVDRSGVSTREEVVSAVNSRRRGSEMSPRDRGLLSNTRQAKDNTP
jgi:hypothetical protein